MKLKSSGVAYLTVLQGIVRFLCLISLRCNGFRTSYFRLVPETANQESTTGILEDFLNSPCLLMCNTRCLIIIDCRSFFYNRFQKQCILTGNMDAVALQPSSGFSHYVIDHCIRTKTGWDYKVNLDRTASGRICQRWYQQSPHSHGYGGLAAHENFCRNIHRDSAESVGPWFYTMDINVRWESCGIPVCYDFTQNCKTTPKGTDYYGKANMTSKGNPCNYWSDTSYGTNAHTFLDDQLNYYRNPFGELDSPWCFSGASWDYCSVPFC